MLREERAPLAGIHSAALVTADLVARLQPRSSHLLLIAPHAGGLRRSYFEAGQLRLSRLVPGLAGPEGSAFAQAAAREAGKFRRYVDSQRLLPADTALDVLVLAPAASMPDLQAACRDAAGLRHAFLDLQTASRRAGVDASTSSEVLLLRLLARHPPANHYAPELAVYQLQQASRTLHTMAAIVALGAAATGGHAALEVAECRREAAAMEAQVPAIDRNPAPSSETVRHVVALYERLPPLSPSPARLLTKVTAAIAGEPKLRFDSLRWFPGEEPGTLGAEGVLSSGRAAVVEGSVDPGTAPRDAVAAVQRLVDALAGPWAQAQAVRLPVDVNPGATLQGRLDGLPRDGRFTVRLNFNAP